MTKIFCFGAIFAALLTSLLGCGEKYLRQADGVLSEIYKLAPSYGICKDVDDCEKNDIALVEGGGKIYVNIYGVIDQVFIAKVVEIALRDGMGVYKGIPMEISVYETPKKNTDFFQKPFFKMEIR